MVSLVKKSKRGKAKLGVDDIAKVILLKGLNFRFKDEEFEVNGKDQPTLDDFNKFISKFSNFIEKEISRICLGSLNSNRVTLIKTFKYNSNTRTSVQNLGSDLKFNTKVNTFIGNETVLSDHTKHHFHTHPYGGFTKSSISDEDRLFVKKYSSITHSIIANGIDNPFTKND